MFAKILGSFYILYYGPFQKVEVRIKKLEFKTLYMFYSEYKYVNIVHVLIV